jgi:hypothetical protein
VNDKHRAHKNIFFAVFEVFAVKFYLDSSFQKWRVSSEYPVKHVVTNSVKSGTDTEKAALALQLIQTRLDRLWGKISV